MRSLLVTGEQIRAARALARIDQAELARRCSLSLETIKRLERIRGPVDANVRTLSGIVEAFEAVGIEFDASEGGGIGVRMPPRNLEWAPPRHREFGGRENPQLPVHRLSYFSTAVSGGDEEAMLREILVESVARNRASGVTGMLMACDGRFLQVLEGSKEAVLLIYGSISVDRRHRDLRLLESRPAAARQFPNWGMSGVSSQAAHAALSEEPSMAEGFRPEVLSPAGALGLLSVVREAQRSAS